VILRNLLISIYIYIYMYREFLRDSKICCAWRHLLPYLFFPLGNFHSLLLLLFLGSMPRELRALLTIFVVSFGFELEDAILHFVHPFVFYFLFL